MYRKMTGAVVGLMLSGFALTSANDAEAFVIDCQGDATTTETSLSCDGQAITADGVFSFSQIGSFETWTIGSSVTADNLGSNVGISLTDTITVAGPYDNGTGIIIEVVATLTGSFFGDALVGADEVIGSLTVIDADFEFHQSQVRIDYQGSEADVLAGDFGTSTGNFSQEIISLDPNDVIIILIITTEVFSFNPTFNLSLNMTTGIFVPTGFFTQFTGTDFLDSAALTIGLPEGFTACGESGFCIPLVGDMLIPEPSTLALFAIGLAGLGFMMRRRRVV